MKARFLALAALVLGLASCQNDFDAANVGAGGEVDFQLSVNAPELATRAGLDGVTPDGQADLNSAYGAIDYLQAKDEGNPDLRTDWDDVNLRYTLEVYDKADSYAADVAPVKDRQVIIVDEYQPVTFELRLVPGRDYHFVVFADFVPQAVTDATHSSAIAAQANIGLHHVIGNTLADIKVKNDGINDECSDAYFGYEDFTITNSASNDIVLKRPYGKLRVIATDLHELNLNVNPKKVKVEYTATHLTNFNAVTGAATLDTENTEVEFDSTYNDVYKEADKGGLANHFYTTGYDALNGANHEQYTNANDAVRHTHMTLFTDYILANNEVSPVHFTMTVYDRDDKEIKSTTFNTDIPVQRNYLTTVIGNVLTTATEVEVRIDDNFAGEKVETLWDGKYKEPAYDAATKTYTIYEESELAWLAAAVNGTLTRASEPQTFEGKTFKLAADIDLDLNGDRWIPIGATGKFLGTFDGQGNTIYNLLVSETGKASAGLFANGRVIKNLNVENAEIYGHYKTGVIIGDGLCAQIENCHVKNAKIVVTPINNDEANNIGGIVGYLSAEPTAYVKNCSVENAEITAYRKVAGIVGAANGASVVTGNTVKNVTITADQTAEYKEFKAAEAGEIAGYINAKAQVENNTVGENVKVIIKVDSNEEAVPALTTECKNLEVVLGNNVDVPIGELGQITGGSGEYKLGAENTETITIDLGGKKLNITTTYWSNLGAKNNNALFTIKNGTMTSSQATGTWNSYDLTFSNCDYVFENVTFEKAVAFDNAGKNVTLNDVTIKETHDYYAMWITATGQTVNIDGLTVESAGRGIKIDEQYVGTPAKVTLNVKDAEFTTVNKAAIMVKSAAGADIALEDVNIEKVAADTVNAVWVDSDAKQHAAKVNVTGGSMVVEGVASITAQDVLNSAIQEENAVVQVVAGEYTFPKNFAKGVTVICEEGTVFNGYSSLNANGATVMGATFKNQSGSAVGGTVNGTYKNCVFDGSNALRGCYAGETVVFENCVFTGDVYGVHFDAGSHDAIFRNCTFSGFNAFGAALTELTLEDCTFVANGRSGYNGINMWGSTNLIRCEFTFDGSVTEWVDVCYSNKSFNIEDCTINGQPFVIGDLGIFGDCDVKLDGEHYGFASSNDGLKYTLEKNASIINLYEDGEYSMPSVAQGKTFAINGKGENTIIKVAQPAGGEMLDGNIDGSTVTFNKVRIVTGNKGAGYNNGFTRPASVTYNECVIDGMYSTINNHHTFNKCTFNQTGDLYNVWTWGAKTATFTECTFNCDGKAVLLYGYGPTVLTMTDCVFNDNGGLVDELKAAIEIGNDYGATYELVVNNATVNGFAINPKGTPTNTTLWANKNSMTQDKLNVVVDGVDVF